MSKGHSGCCVEMVELGGSCRVQVTGDGGLD